MSGWVFHLKSAAGGRTRSRPRGSFGARCGRKASWITETRSALVSRSAQFERIKESHDLFLIAGPDPGFDRIRRIKKLDGFGGGECSVEKRQFVEQSREI